MKAVKLEIGERYYLDRCKDTSGVYRGKNERGVNTFGDLVNNYMYIENEKGEVGFFSDENYYLMEDEN